LTGVFDQFRSPQLSDRRRVRSWDVAATVRDFS
jgi:hypothetical protein